jgi:hypothetical protein
MSVDEVAIDKKACCPSSSQKVVQRKFQKLDLFIALFSRAKTKPHFFIILNFFSSAHYSFLHL